MPEEFKPQYISEEMRQIVEAEGDKKAFEYRGVYLEINRVDKQHSGHLCGYLTQPDNIPDSAVRNVDVHGSWTYHRNNVWGFDCARTGDIKPISIMGENAMYADEFFTPQYRTMFFVEQELKNAVDQMFNNLEDAD